MANVQHIFYTNGNPNEDNYENQVALEGATPGSHCIDSLSGVPYILSATGLWHPVLPLVRGNGDVQYMADAPVGSSFVSNPESVEQYAGIMMGSGWVELSTIKSTEDFDGLGPHETRFVVDPLNNRLCVYMGDGVFKYVALQSFT